MYFIDSKFKLIEMLGEEDMNDENMKRKAVQMSINLFNYYY